MKKILLIGKMNEVLKDLSTYLANYLNIQFSPANIEVIDNMILLGKPDLIFVSMIGVTNMLSDVFAFLYNSHSSIPVLTLGTAAEVSRFSGYYRGMHFQNIERPVENEKVLNAIAKRLKISKDELIAGAAGAQVQTEAKPVEEKPQEQKQEQDDSRKTVLIVDDNAATLRGIKGMLDDTYKVVMAPSGIKAMTLIGKKRPDCILLDYEMPVVDGKQTLEMIRADEELASIPVIFLTGIADREHIAAVVGLKPAGYLLKPPIKEKLVATIEKAIAE